MMVLRCGLKLSENRTEQGERKQNPFSKMSSLTPAFNYTVWPKISSCKCLFFPKRQRECSSPHPPAPTLLTIVSFSAVSVTRGQWQSEKRREMTHHSQLAWWHLSLLTPSCQGFPIINIVCFQHPTIDIIMAPWSRVTQSRRASLWLIIRSIVA